MLWPKPVHATRVQPIHTVEVWPANHGRQALVVSNSNSLPAASVDETHHHHHDSFSIRGGFVDDTPHHHSSPVVDIQSSIADSPSTRVAGQLLLMIRPGHSAGTFEFQHSTSPQLYASVCTLTSLLIHAVLTWPH